MGKKGKKKEKEVVVEGKSQNKLLIFLLSVFAALILVTTVLVTMYLEGTEKESIKILDVAGMSITDATNALDGLGFEVLSEYKYVASDEIEEGLVVKTNPPAGTNKREGSEITLYVSSGEGVYIVEDFTGKDYREVKGKIEAECDCNVLVEFEKVDEKDNLKEDTVIRTEPASGEKSKMGETITIYIPEIEYKYPDFTSNYTISMIEEFADKHDLKLEIKYQEDASLAEGTIIKQSRAAKSVVTQGATLVITVSRLPEEEIVEGEDTGGETEDNQNITGE